MTDTKITAESCVMVLYRSLLADPMLTLDGCERAIAALAEHLGTTPDGLVGLVQRFDAQVDKTATLRASLSAAEAKLARMEEALRKSAEQKMYAELTEDQQDEGDFIGAYDTFIEIARAALGDPQ